MKNSRRDFLRIASLAGAGLAGTGWISDKATEGDGGGERGKRSHSGGHADFPFRNGDGQSIIGDYGPWGNSMLERELPEFSLRRLQWANRDHWRSQGRRRLGERLAMPVLEGVPEVRVERSFTYDGLHIEQLVWQLPYGRPTKATLLKPVGAQGRLPGILAFYDHGLQKYFGPEKITRTADRMHPILEDHYRDYYEGAAWANEIAHRGYVVLVPDVFSFGNRRVRPEEVTEPVREGLSFRDPENLTVNEIEAYNQWAARHEHIVAKSLFSAGTTWPGVFLAEDRASLDVLCSRPDVDENRVGCGGLSGGGIRTVYMGGFDPRIKCAVCVGFMTTWKDLILQHSFTHTWMTFTPLLPKDLEFPEILGLRAPNPTLVLNNVDDPLFDYKEMKRADQIMGEVFSLAEGEERYRCNFHPGPHKFDRAMQREAFDWFDRWLSD